MHILNESVLKKQQHNNGFPTFKLPTSTKILYDWLVKYYCLISVYDYMYKAIGLSSVVYIFHKGIIS